MEEINQGELVNASEGDLLNKSFEYMVKAGKWGKFLAVFGLVGSSILLLAGIFLLFTSSKIKEFTGTNSDFSSLQISVVYIIIALGGLLLTIFLNTFSNQVIKGAQERNGKRLVVAFKNLKNLFAFFGIGTICFLIIYIISMFFILNTTFGI